MLSEPDPRIAKQFGRYLRTGEKIEWTGITAMDQQRRRARSVTIAGALIGALIAAAFGIVFLSRAFGARVTYVFLVAALIMVACKLRTLSRGMRRLYAITNRRVLILGRGSGNNLFEVALSNADPTVDKLEADGSGTVVFKDQLMPLLIGSLAARFVRWAPHQYELGSEIFVPTSDGGIAQKLTLDNIPEVVSVHDLILRLKRELPPQQP